MKCQAYLAVCVVFPVHFPPALFNETIDMGSDQISSGYHYSYPFRSFSFAETDIFKHTQAISKHIPKTIQLAKLVIQHVIYIYIYIYIQNLSLYKAFGNTNIIY